MKKLHIDEKTAGMYDLSIKRCYRSSRLTLDMCYRNNRIPWSGAVISFFFCRFRRNIPTGKSQLYKTVLRLSQVLSLASLLL